MTKFRVIAFDFTLEKSYDEDSKWNGCAKEQEYGKVLGDYDCQ